MAEEKSSLKLGGSINAVMQAVKKQFGENSIRVASDIKNVFVPFELPAFDFVSGGGVRRGSFVKLSGNPAAGKSTTAMLLCSRFQKRCRFCNGRLEFKTIKSDLPLKEKKVTKSCGCSKPTPMNVLWIDTEAAFSPSFFEALGGVPSSTIVITPESAETLFDQSKDLILSGQIDLIILDSIAQSGSFTEIKAEASKKQVGINARLMNRGLRLWTSLINMVNNRLLSEITFVLVNQYRSEINLSWARQTEPGGRGQNYSSSLTIITKVAGELVGLNEYGVEERVGSRVTILASKSRTGSLGRQANYEFYFKESGRHTKGSFDKIKQLLTLGVKFNVIKQAGSWFTLSNGEKFRGRDAVAEYFKENEDALTSLMEELEPFYG